MDYIITILASTSLLLVLVTYIITKIIIENKIKKYSSLEEGIKKTKEEIHTLENKRDVLRIVIDKARKDFNHINDETTELQKLKGRESILIDSINIKENHLKNDEKLLKNLDLIIESTEEKVNELKSNIDLYSRIDEYISYGHFERPKYIYETSVRYVEEIKYVRQQQKKMIKDKSAVTFPERLIISDDKVLNNKIINGQVKLMLTSFNIECDNLIGKVSPSSFGRTLERIEKLANNLEKSAATLRCGFNISYIELKFEECKLQYQYTLKKKEEITEQKLIKEQIREEQRAIKEFEMVISEAEKEEKMYRSLLDKAREELVKGNETERSAMEKRIAILEHQLLEVEAKEARAKSMAEQTRKGHVYVISNIGSFGKGIYKIGLTRRLEPADRVKELSGASVPFPFDIHAMIYTDDAPALETALHREFNAQRVNAVNIRKEFFNVDLEEIKEAVIRIAGVEAEFKMTALAEDYYESLRLNDAA